MSISMERTPAVEAASQPESTMTSDAPKQIGVRLAQLGQEVVDISGEKGMTVRQALAKAQKSVPDGLELRVNNVNASLDRELKDGEIIMLIPRIRGGQGDDANEMDELAIVVCDANCTVLAAMWFERQK